MITAAAALRYKSTELNTKAWVRFRNSLIVQKANLERICDAVEHCLIDLGRSGGKHVSGSGSKFT